MFRRISHDERPAKIRLAMNTPRANSRSAHTRHYRVRNFNMHVRHWEGNAQPLRVILHGWLDLSATWQRLVDHLPADWAIAAPDQRGFGHSDAVGDTYWFYDYVADLDALLDQLSPDQPIDLIGHSMGSQVAALYAGVRPQRVRRLVLLDGFYLPQTTPERAPQQLRNWLDDLRSTPEEKRYPDLDTLAEKIAKRQRGLDAAGARFVAECWSSPSDDGQVTLLGDARHRQRGPLLYRDEEAKAIFRQVSAPTLLVDAGQSVLAGMGKSEVRQQRLECFEQRTHVSIEQAGHMLHFDAPDATAQHIESFLSAAEPG